LWRWWDRWVIFIEGWVCAKQWWKRLQCNLKHRVPGVVCVHKTPSWKTRCIVQYRKWHKAPLVSQRFILFIGSFSPERSIILILMIADQLLECVDLIWCTAGSWLTAPWYACVHQLGSIISWFIWLPGIYTHNHLSLSLDRDCNRHDSTAAGGGVPPWRLHNVPPMVGKKDGIQLLYIHKHLRLAFYERLVIHFMAWHGMAWHWTTTTTTIRDSSGAKTHGRTVRVWFCYGR